MSQIRVETIHTPEDVEEILTLQAEIWHYGRPGADPLYPARALRAFSKSGGLVTRAVIEEKSVGFSVAWIGREEKTGEYYLHSQLVGVLPQFRQMGIGYQLKLFQRSYALEKGLKLIRWTFDPLQSQNARFNLSRLGAISQEYHPDFYGPLKSRFSGSLSSDRLWAEWYLESSRVEARLAESRQIQRISIDPEEFSILSVPVTEDSPDEVFVEIPPAFDTFRERDREAVLRCQKQVRTLLTSSFEQGYVAVDLWLSEKEDHRRAFYRLVKDPLV